MCSQVQRFLQQIDIVRPRVSLGGMIDLSRARWVTVRTVYGACAALCSTSLKLRDKCTTGQVTLGADTEVCESIACEPFMLERNIAQVI